MINNFRKYGSSPFKIGLIHGGPGASGYMAPVAKELSEDYGVVEALQTKMTVPEQVKELHFVLKEHANIPVILIGHSWGAWLSCIFAAEFPELVEKLILISSGSFQTKYTGDISRTRKERLNKDERLRLDSLTMEFNNPKVPDKSQIFSEFGKLMSKADSYQLIPGSNSDINFQFDIFKQVWGEADEMRKTGDLIRILNKIKCEVVAIHGDHDPHPFAGVKEPCSKYIKDFKFILLKKCGHYPWNEQFAKKKFYNILRKELI